MPLSGKKHEGLCNRFVDMLLDFGMESRLSGLNERDFPSPYVDPENDEEERMPWESEIERRTEHYAKIITAYMQECGEVKSHPEKVAFQFPLQSLLIRLTEKLLEAIIHRPIHNNRPINN